MTLTITEQAQELRALADRMVEFAAMGEDPSATVRIEWGVNDCPVLRALASIYSDRPGYDPEWRTT